MEDTEPAPDPSVAPRGDQPRVTVVVPVYEVEEYLGDCLASIAAQTAIDDLRVVIVDDGSTDRSGEIADEFAQQHPDRVLVIHQDNRGLGAARNRGLDAVDTEFVAFLDSDDLLPVDAVASLLAAMVLNPEADVAVGRMATFPKVTDWPWLVHLDGPGVVTAPIDDVPELIHSPSACNKLFRVSLVTERGLRFGEGVHFEDVPFVLPLLLESRSIALVPTLVYLYRKRESATSIMDSLWNRTENYRDHVTVNEWLTSAAEDLGPERRRVLDLFLVRSLQGFLWRAPHVLPEAELDQFFDRVRALVGHVDDEVLMAACLDLRHRLPYLALRNGSRAAFRDVLSTVRDLDAVDGAVSVVLDESMGPTSHLVRSVRRFSAHLEAVERHPRGDGLRLVGSFALDGLVPRALPDGRLAVRVRGSGVTQRATSVLRQRTIGSVEGRFAAGYVVDIPARRLRPGEHNLRLVVVGDSGQASRTLNPSLGLRRAIRGVPLGRRRATPTIDRWNNAALRVEEVRGRRQRVLAWISTVASDVGGVVTFRRMAAWRLLQSLTRPLMRGRRPWLLAERLDTAQDNSATLFRYLRRQRAEIPAYYLIRRDASHAARVRGRGRVLAHSSWRHRFLMLHAAWLVSSYDIDAYMLPRQWTRSDYLDHLAARSGTRRAFLQHGVIYNDVRPVVRRATTGLDLLVTSAQREAEFLRTTTGYQDQVAVTGLPRFDTLARRTVGPYILFMPTWRVYLGTPSYRTGDTGADQFTGSDYERFVVGLATHPVLTQELTARGIELRVLPHYEVARQLLSRAAEVPGLRVLDQGTVDIQEELCGASLLVTDWSSVFFDAALVGVPVVLTPFDEDSPTQRPYRPGYFDLRIDGFGPVATELEDAVALILHYATTGFVREPEYSRRADEFFKDLPPSSCEAVVAALEARSGWPRHLPAIEAYNDRG